MHEHALVDHWIVWRAILVLGKFSKLLFLKTTTKMSHLFTQKSNNFYIFVLKKTMLILSNSSKFGTIGKLPEYFIVYNHNYLEMYFHVARKTNFMIRHHTIAPGTHINRNTHLQKLIIFALLFLKPFMVKGQGPIPQKDTLQHRSYFCVCVLLLGRSHVNI